MHANRHREEIDRLKKENAHLKGVVRKLYSQLQNQYTEQLALVKQQKSSLSEWREICNDIVEVRTTSSTKGREEIHSPSGDVGAKGTKGTKRTKGYSGTKGSKGTNTNLPSSVLPHHDERAASHKREKNSTRDTVSHCRRSTRLRNKRNNPSQPPKRSKATTTIAPTRTTNKDNTGVEKPRAIQKKSSTSRVDQMAHANDVDQSVENRINVAKQTNASGKRKASTSENAIQEPAVMKVEEKMTIARGSKRLRSDAPSPPSSSSSIPGFAHSEEAQSMLASPSAAMLSFQRWRKAHWFAPAGFGDVELDSRPPHVSAYNVPYYMIDAHVSFGQEERVSFIQEPLLAVLPNALTKAYPWLEDIQLVCDWAVQRRLGETASLSRHFSSLLNHHKISSGEATPCTCASLQPMPFESFKAHMVDQLVRLSSKRRKGNSEMAGAEPYSVQGLSAKLSFVPIYVIRYWWGDDERYFIANAWAHLCPTRMYSPKPPLGLGILDGGVRVLEGLYGLTDEELTKPVMASGKQLREVDSCTAYDIRGEYLLIPPSQSAFITYRTGHITLCNAGERDITLSSQKRGCRDVVSSITISPGESESFDYKGRWVVRVHQASAGDLRVTSFNISEGTGHNRLKMSFWGL